MRERESRKVFLGRLPLLLAGLLRRVGASTLDGDFRRFRVRASRGRGVRSNRCPEGPSGAAHRRRSVARSMPGRGMGSGRNVCHVRRLGWQRPSVVPGLPGPGSVDRATTTASSRCSPAPSARSRPACSAAACARSARSSRSWPCWSARSGPGSRPTPTLHRGAARRAAQAARRHRHDPRQDRHPRPPLLALLAEDAGRLRLGAELKREMQRRPPARSRLRAGGPTSRRRRAPRAAASARSCRSRWSPGSWPTRSSCPTSPAPPAPRRPRRLAGWELIGPLLTLLRARRRRRRRPAWPCPSRPTVVLPPGLELMPHQARVRRRGRGGPPHVPARRRAGPRQDRPGAARRAGRRRLPAAGRRAERRQDQLGPRGRDAGRRATRPP